jgi:hypothetical protein
MDPLQFRELHLGRQENSRMNGESAPDRRISRHDRIAAQEAFAFHERVVNSAGLRDQNKPRRRIPGIHVLTQCEKNFAFPFARQS